MRRLLRRPCLALLQRLPFVNTCLMQLERGDPHCHTTASDGLATPAELVAAAVVAGLDLIAVTDHDTMSAVAETTARGEAAGLAVVAGEEVTCRWPEQTHVLALYLERPVRSGRSLQETVDAIHDQGGLVVIPHPFMPTYFASCQPGQLDRLLAERRIDGIETHFTAPITAGRAHSLAAFVSSHPDQIGAHLGASDSHFGHLDLGRVLTEYPGRGAAGFRAAIEQRTTRPQVGTRQPIPASLLARQQLKSLVELPLRRLSGRLG